MRGFAVGRSGSPNLCRICHESHLLNNHTFFLALAQALSPTLNSAENGAERGYRIDQESFRSDSGAADGSNRRSYSGTFDPVMQSLIP
jgi:uncharacterized membrane protein